MQYCTLGTSDLRVSRIGYGAWALGKKGWGNVNEAEAAATIEAAIAAGINFFDTAPVYGFGRSEQVLGDVLSGGRLDVLVATKCGLVWNERGGVRHDLSRDAVLRDLEGSLQRLGTDYIDLYQIHWPDRRTPLAETMQTLAELRQAGVIRHIGVGNFSPAQLQAACGLADIVSVQHLYNMLQREDAEALLPLCSRHGLGFIAYSPLAQGLLGGGLDECFRPGRQDVRRLNPLYRNRERFAAAVRYARSLPSPPAAAAMRFLFGQAEVACVLVSMTQRKHLAMNLQALGDSKV